MYAAEIEDAVSCRGSLMVKSAIQTVLELSLVLSILFDFKNYCDEINIKKMNEFSVVLFYSAKIEMSLNQA